MTVCIAAISTQPLPTRPMIVTASDTMVSGSIVSSDMLTLKADPFHPKWTAMMAGDLSQCVAIVEKAKEYFTSHRNRTNTLAVARSVFKRAFQRHVAEMREDAILGGYGMTMAEFLKSGKRRFTASKFDALCDRMEAIKPECEFLIHGFDSLKRPHIFRVDGYGSDSVFDKTGFCAIGCGRWMADATLHSLGQSVDSNFPETIFNVCAAKFAAERSDGVGRFTYLYARHNDSAMFLSGYGMIEAIRAAWENNGCPRVPDGIVDRIAGFNPRCLPEPL